LLSPVLGLVAVARPSVTRMRLGNQINGPAAATLDDRFFDGTIGRWLGVGGFALLAMGWLAMGFGVLASNVLNRADGFLVLVGIGVAVIAALSWHFLLVIAAMIMLASALGLSWTASRLTPDGGAPDDD
jgi:hypothetical protein